VPGGLLSRYVSVMKMKGCRLIGSQITTVTGEWCVFVGDGSVACRHPVPSMGMTSVNVRETKYRGGEEGGREMCWELELTTLSPQAFSFKIRRRGALVPPPYFRDLASEKQRVPELLTRSPTA
jgi:hypothetical protein